MVINSSHRWASFLFVGVAFFLGISALLVTINVAMKNTENRSKAAETEMVVKRWDFLGTTLEEWAVSIGTWNVSRGSARGTYAAGNLLAIKTAQSLHMPQGNKYLKVRMAAGPALQVERNSAVLGVQKVLAAAPQWWEQMMKNRPSLPPVEETTLTPTAVPTPTPTRRQDMNPLPPVRDRKPPEPVAEPFTLEFLYDIAEKSSPGGVRYLGPPQKEKANREPDDQPKDYPVGWTPEPPRQRVGIIQSEGSQAEIQTRRQSVKVEGIADGSMHEYTLLLPDIGATQMMNLEIHVVGVERDDIALIDWIQLSGMMQTATPSPTQAERPNPCLGRPDGESCQINSCPVCNTTDVRCLTQQCNTAAGQCQNQQCVVGPAVSPGVTFGPTPTPIGVERPTISSITPMTVRRGDVVIIRGTNFLPSGVDVTSLTVLLSKGNGSAISLASVINPPGGRQPEWTQNIISFVVPENMVVPQSGTVTVTVNNYLARWPDVFTIAPAILNN